MAYIGTKPTIGNFQICDAISVVNGQAAYTMQVGSVNVIPQSANHMIVSLNGTIQKPNSSFTVSGSTITFASNLATGDVIDFIQILGDVLDLGVPSDATVTTAKLASDSVTYEKIGYNANQFRNIIINGDMSIAQRGTSTSSITGNGYHTVDRFQTIASSLGTWTQSQSTDVPTGQGFATSLKMDCTTADASPASGDNLYIRQKIEGQNLQYLKKGTSSSESLTLSFWVKSNKTGTAQVNLVDEDNSRLNGRKYTISSANTWEKKTLTFDGDTSGVFTNDNGTSLRLEFWLDAGSNYTSGTTPTTWQSNTSADQFVGCTLALADSTSNDWYITGVQLEAGTSASDFEFLPYDVNLSRCQRYFELQQSTYFVTSKYNSSYSYGSLGTYKEKRANPTIARLGGASTVYAHGNGQGGSTSVAFALADITKTGCGLRVSGGNSYDTWFNGIDTPFTFDAEL